MKGRLLAGRAILVAAGMVALEHACAESAPVECVDESCEVLCNIQGYAAGACQNARTCVCTGGTDADADADVAPDAAGDDGGAADDRGGAETPDAPPEADRDGALAGTPGHIGGACGSDADCVDEGATCLRTLAGILTFPNGYCSVIGCPAPGPWSCPAGASCQCDPSGDCMCLMSCTSSAQCRSSEGYVCTEGYCLPLPL
jgi:hypothetical protein